MEPNSAQLFDIQDTQSFPNPTSNNPKSDANDMFNAFSEINQKNDSIPVNMENAKDESAKDNEEEEFKFANSNIERKKVLTKQEAFEPYVYH